MSRPAGEGRLVIVGTPIGNLGDLSARAIETLSTVDAIACEDTRRTGRLLQLAGLPKRPLLVANEHTELRRSVEILDRLRSGEQVALVSDAGMPGISDPGRRIVGAVLDAGLRVEVVPGPTAMTSALVLSGFDVDRFVFEGFLHRKGAQRREQLAEIAGSSRAVVIYESPKRVVKTVGELAEVCGPDRRVLVARELTKLHEESIRGTFSEMVEILGRREARGEYVIVVEGSSADVEDLGDDEIRRLLREEIDHGASRRDAVASVMARTGLPKRRIYDLSL